MELQYPLSEPPLVREGALTCCGESRKLVRPAAMAGIDHVTAARTDCMWSPVQEAARVMRPSSCAVRTSRMFRVTAMLMPLYTCSCPPEPWEARLCSRLCGIRRPAQMRAQCMPPTCRAACQSTVQGTMSIWARDSSSGNREGRIKPDESAWHTPH